MSICLPLHFEKEMRKKNVMINLSPYRHMTMKMGTSIDYIKKKPTNRTS